MFLSQPPIATSPSKPSAPATVSIESAITSRDTSEYFIPSVPIEMPSDTVMVPKMTAFPPAPFTPVDARAESVSMCMLHGVTSLQVGTHADLRLAEVGAREADGVQHRAARRAGGTVEHDRRMRATGRFGHGRGDSTVYRLPADSRLPTPDSEFPLPTPGKSLPLSPALRARLPKFRRRRT